MNISALYSNYHAKSGEQNDKIISFVAASLLHIIGNYFAIGSNNFALILCCRNNYTCNFYNQIFHKMFAEWKDWPLQIVEVNKMKNEQTHNVQHNNIVLTDSYESLMHIFIHTNVEDDNKNEYYVIHLQTSDHLFNIEMEKIFEYCWKNNLINCVVQTQKENGQILMFTYFPFTEKFCGKIKSVLVNEYNGTTLIHKELFPMKLKNFYGCPLRVALCHVPPYIYLSKDSNNITFISGGFEGKLLLEISKKLNFSLDLIVPVDDCNKMIFMYNNSLYGTLKMVRDRKADISLGGIRQTKENTMLLTPTRYYFQSKWVVVVLKEVYSLTSLETFLFPFAKSTWYLFSIISIFTLLVVGTLKLKLPKYQLKYLDYFILDMLSMALGISAPFEAVYNTTRLLTAAFTMFTLVLRTFYQALLFHLIRTHIIRDTPQILKELVNQNYSLIVDKYTLGGLEELPVFKGIHFIVFNATTNEMTLSHLETVPLDKVRYMAVAISLLRLQYYVQLLKKTNVFEIIPENIMNIKLCMYLGNHSFLTEQFDNVITMFRGFGILEAWLDQNIDQNYIQNSPKYAYLAFGMEKLKVVFALVLIGNFLATIVFITELLYERIKRINNKYKLKCFVLIKNV